MPPSFDAESVAKFADALGEAAKASEAEARDGDTSMERRLLVVDDDESVRHVVAEILNDEGYEPSTAPGAARASAAVVCARASAMRLGDAHHAQRPNGAAACRSCPPD